jgi:alpha-galactosidase
MKSGFLLFCSIIAVFFISRSYASENLNNGFLSIYIDKGLGTEVQFNEQGKNITAASSEKIFSVEISGKALVFPENLTNVVKSGNEIKVTATDESKKVKVILTLSAEQEFNNSVSGSIKIENISGSSLELSKVSVLNLTADAKNLGADSSYKFWSFQGGSYIFRPDWVLPVTKDYTRENFMGNNSPDYGGGIPVVDLWAKNGGIVIASTSEYPEQIYLPVTASDKGVEFSISDRRKNILKAGETYSFIPFTILLHHGDFYNALNLYSKIMQKKNLTFPPTVPAALESEWCAWGYARDFVPSQLTGTLAKAKELGFKWATLDDGWQSADGDWELMKSKFPNGDSDFKAIVDSMHKYGLKARLWWVPYSANDSAYNVKHYPDRMNEYAMKVQSKLALEHPDWFMLDEKGNRYQIEWWNSYLLCPALPEVQEHFEKFITKAINVWGFDGFKIDGQNINAVPPCYNPKHNHKHPEDASKAVPGFFKMVYNTTYSLKKDAVIQICPCGTNFSLYNIPYTTQFVSSDPSSSWQVRHRGKVFKALVGNAIPFAGDHVELTNRKWVPEVQKSLPYKEEDFASTIAVGGVIATKFTMPNVAQADSTLMLTPDKEEKWKHWSDIYDKERLSEGEYVNLYDVAFDVPETHLIKKGDVNYYSFFSDEHFIGKVELRGLGNGSYSIIDYVNNKIIGEASSSSPVINVEFTDHLLLKAVEIK